MSEHCDSADNANVLSTYLGLHINILIDLFKVGASNPSGWADWVQAVTVPSAQSEVRAGSGWEGV